MSPGFIVMLVLFLLSMAAGVAVGEWYFRLFLKAVPPVALSDFNTQSARIAHWLYGGGVGLVLFAFTWLGMAASRMIQMMARPTEKS